LTLPAPDVAKRSHGGLDGVPCFAALISCGPLLFGGYPQGHDWAYELARVAEFSHAVEDGQLPPHWAPNLYGGYGSPIFLFYAPVFAALAAAGSALLGSWAAGSSLVLVCFSIIGVLAIRRLFDAIPEVDPRAGRIAATVFALHPYLIGDKLLRNANAEFAALCLLPFVLEGLLRVDRRPLRGAIIVAGGLAGVALTHNLTTLFALALLVGGTLWLHGWRGALRVRAALASGMALGLLVAAFALLPAVMLRDAVHLEELLRGKFDFHGQWKPLSQFFSYSKFFSAGALTPLLLVVAGWVCVRSVADGFAERRLLAGMLVAALIAIALQLPLSTPLWEVLPALPFLQFPWRFMGPLALVSTVAGAIAVTRVLASCAPAQRGRLELVIFAVCVANAWPQLASYRSLSPGQIGKIEFATRPGQLRREALNATVLDEYLPSAANSTVWKRAARFGGEPWKIVGAEAQIELLDDKGSGISLRANAPRGTRLRLARWYFPGWEANLDGAPVAIESNRSGGIAVTLSAPGGELELVRRAPVSRRIGLALSALGVGLWLALYLIELKRRRRDRVAIPATV
jgi:hypothetical protein